MKKSILILILYMLQAAVVRGQADWKFLTAKSGIKVYTKSIPGSKIKAVRIECNVNASASEVVALLMDIPAAVRWVSHTKSCVLIRKVSPAELYYYTEISLPWPLENRDFSAHVKVSQDLATKIVTVNAPAVPGWVPVKPGIVRINHSKGFWTITPIDKGRVKIDYILEVDPGGNIPPVVVNTFASQGPIETFMNMRKELQTGKYKSVVTGIE
ncbi:START domain-containing protein [Dyadobacter bucti]|uniref:START domain-containing protein n=1 Tax=Dyadobacter bucti TaxID=2572203 RepID=UPI003F6EC46D